MTEGPGEKKHTNVLAVNLPKNTKDLQVIVKGMADSMANFAVETKRPLALVAFAMVSEEGAMPTMMEQFGKSMDVDPDRMGFAFMCALGKALLDAEKAVMKAERKKDDGGTEMTEDWVKEHRGLCTFSQIAFAMEEITCDCPACIVFWTAKRYLEQMTPPDLVEELKVVVQADNPRGNPGCVKHKIPESGEVTWMRISKDE